MTVGSEVLARRRNRPFGLARDARFLFGLPPRLFLGALAGFFFLAAPLQHRRDVAFQRDEFGFDALAPRENSSSTRTASA